MTAGGRFVTVLVSVALAPESRLVCGKNGSRPSLGERGTTKTDRGIVVILDPRLLTKAYGRTFLSSLPDCPRVIENLNESRNRLDPDSP